MKIYFIAIIALVIFWPACSAIDKKEDKSFGASSLKSSLIKKDSGYEMSLALNESLIDQEGVSEDEDAEVSNIPSSEPSQPPQVDPIDSPEHSENIQVVCRERGEELKALLRITLTAMVDGQEQSEVASAEYRCRDAISIKLVNLLPPPTRYAIRIMLLNGKHHVVYLGSAEFSTDKSEVVVEMKRVLFRDVLVKIVMPKDKHFNMITCRFADANARNSCRVKFAHHMASERSKHMMAIGCSLSESKFFSNQTSCRFKIPASVVGKIEAEAFCRGNDAEVLDSRTLEKKRFLSLLIPAKEDKPFKGCEGVPEPKGAEVVLNFSELIPGKKNGAYFIELVQHIAILLDQQEEPVALPAPERRVECKIDSTGKLCKAEVPVGRWEVVTTCDEKEIKRYEIFAKPSAVIEKTVVACSSKPEPIVDCDRISAACYMLHAPAICTYASQPAVTAEGGNDCVARNLLLNKICSSGQPVLEEKISCRRK